MLDPALDDVRPLAMDFAVQVHARSHDGSPAADERLTATAEAIRGWLTTDPAQTALETRITQLEAQMTAFNDRVEELRVAVDNATNRVAEKLQQLRDELAQRDQAAADALQPLIAELNEMGADPTNPIPEPGPEPV